jgi:hypothetical protein
VPQYSKGQIIANGKSFYDWKFALLSGLFVLLGGAIGSGLTGYFAIQTQRLALDQQRDLFAKQLAQSDRQELKSILSDYSEVLTDYMRLISNQKLSTNDIDQLGKKAFKSAFVITLIVSLDLGQKTFEVNDLLLTNLKRKNESTYSPEMQKLVVTKVGEWVAIAKVELKLLEYSAKPENLSTDLPRLLLNGAASSKGNN